MKRYDRRALLTLLLVVLGVWLVAREHDYPPGDPLDTALILGLGFGSLAACAFMAEQTHKWTIRALGLFSYVAGVGAIFAPAGVAILLSGQTPRWFLTLGRSFLYVGLPLLIWGIVETIVVTRRERRANH